MIRPKGWFKSLGDRDLDLQERLFRLLIVIGLCGLAAVIINGIAIGEDKTNIVPLVIAFFVLVGITCFSLYAHKIQLGAASVGAVFIYLVLPFYFLTHGGIYGGAPVYLLFGMVYVCLVVEGKVKYIYLASSFIIDAACYYAVYNNPERFTMYTPVTAYINSNISLVIVGGTICGMILYQNWIFQSENTIVKEQMQEIEELNRAQNHFFSSMSHEIRTPINTIIGLNELILRADVSDVVAADAMNIQGASNMLLTLINDFLDVSKIEAGKMDIVPAAYDVGAMLSEIVNMIWVRAKDKGLEFHINVDQTVPAQLYGDEVRIKQILINLLGNAVKYTQAGSVTLSIKSKKENGDSPDHAQVIYSVTDTGIGIKEESIPYLFSAFQRVNEEENRYIEGTGLGLSIVKQLVNLMDGDIAVNSVYTKGSTFVVTLPQKIASEEMIGNLDLESKRTLGIKKQYKHSFEAPEAHVLIVDDSEMNLMVAVKLLQNTRIQIDTVTSGAKCLERTVQNRYEVILMDHLMPGMDGIECLHAIRTQTGGMNHDTPVVILTANAGGEEQALYRREEFDGYLLKPVDGRQLEAELLKHLPRELVSMTSADGFVGVTESPSSIHKKKLPVMITTESVCDLPKNLVDKYQVAVMPYRVVTEGGEFLDGIEADTDGILSYITAGGKSARYVRANECDVSEYEKFFANQLTKAHHIVHITMGEKLHHDFSHAVEAAKAFDHVIVVDSGHVTCGMGIVVLQAAKYAADGMSAEAIVNRLEDIKKRIRTSFVVDNTECLMRAERISPGFNQICQALMLHPVLVLKNSSLKLGGVRIGSKDRAWRKYIASTLNAMGKIDTRMLYIAHAGLTKEELEDIKEQVNKKIVFQNVICRKVTPAISTNCGPGSFGLLFVMK